MFGVSVRIPVSPEPARPRPGAEPDSTIVGPPGHPGGRGQQLRLGQRVHVIHADHHPDSPAFANAGADHIPFTSSIIDQLRPTQDPQMGQIKLERDLTLPKWGDVRPEQWGHLRQRY